MAIDNHTLCVVHCSSVNLRNMKKLLRIFQGDVNGKVIKEYSDGSVKLEDKEDEVSKKNSKR